MKLFFSLFLIFFSLSFQAKALVLIPYPADLSQFDWSAFSDHTNIQKHIDLRNEMFSLVGAGALTVNYINIDKLQLVEIEKELYRLQITKGLTLEELQRAREALELHWKNISDIENQIRNYAGLGGVSKNVEGIQITPIVGDIADYREGVWELYKSNHDIAFNFIEKTDEDFYKLFDGDDKAYAQFISSYIQDYTTESKMIAEGYFNSLQSAYDGKIQFNRDDVDSLFGMYSRSLDMYKCAKKNFGKVAGQTDLIQTVENWHIEQSWMGANSLIETYNHYGMESNPHSIVRNLLQFKDAPDKVRIKVAGFFRNIWNDEEFKMGTDQIQKWIHINSLIGLKYLNALNPEEEEAFNRAIKEGMIRNPGKGDVFGIGNP